MAPPIVTNTDFNQWQGWQQVRAPGGQATYYVIPGYGDQYVFDPYTSNATGEITIYRNPAPVYAEAEKQRKEKEKAGSLVAQLAVPAGAIAGSLGVDYVSDLIRGGSKEAATQTAADAFTSAAGGSGTGGGAGFGGAITPSYGASPADAAAYYGPEIAANPELLADSVGTSVGEAAQAVGSGAYRQPATGIFGQPTGTLAPLNVAQGALGAAGLAFGSKGVYDAYKNNDPLGGAIGGASAGAGGLALAGALGASTGGLALPVIAGAALFGGGLGLLGDKPSTKEIQEKRRKRLLEADPSVGQVYQGLNIPVEESFAQTQAAREQFPEGYVGWDPSGQVFVNRVFEESGDPNDLTAWDVAGTIDNFETFGSRWITGLSEKQRLAIMNRAIREGKVDPEKGALEVDYDEDLLGFANQQFQAFADGNADPTDPSLLAGVPPRAQPLPENEQLQHLTPVQPQTEAPRKEIQATRPSVPGPVNDLMYRFDNDEIQGKSIEDVAQNLAIMMDNRQQLGAGRPRTIGEIKKQRRGE